MEKKECTLAIITARGGSKRIPRKNIKEFCGKPIMAYSIEAALSGGVFDVVMVSTDDEEIAEIIAPQFAETNLDTITTIVKRYYEQDTWKSDLIFEQESFELLQDILDLAGELSERAPYENLVNTEFAEKAVK